MDFSDPIQYPEFYVKAARSVTSHLSFKMTKPYSERLAQGLAEFESKDERGGKTKPVAKPKRGNKAKVKHVKKTKRGAKAKGNKPKRDSKAKPASSQQPAETGKPGARTTGETTN